MNGHAFWRDKHVIVTGASSGIGAALARHLVGQGSAVGLIARRREQLEGLRAALEATGGRAAIAVADVRDASAVVAATTVLETELGPCDVLIANAGVYRKTRAHELDVDRASDVITTNVLGVVHACAAVVPGMIERRRGHIAAVSSLGAAIGLRGAGAYCASKSAVVTLMESFRLDLAPLGIRVTTLCPSFVDTPMITDAERATLKNLLTADEAARRMARSIARGDVELWFPWHERWLIRLARWLPQPIFRRVMRSIPEMEETDG